MLYLKTHFYCLRKDTKNVGDDAELFIFDLTHSYFSVSNATVFQNSVTKRFPIVFFFAEKYTWLW